MIPLLLMLAETANGSIPESLYRSTREYKSCLIGSAMSLEASDAPVDDIFSASKTACVKEWDVEYQEYLDYLRSKPPSPTGKAPETISIEIISDQEGSVKDELRLNILKIRAARRRL